MANKHISFAKFGFMGRLGNMLFEIASLYGMGKRYGRTVYLPSWDYQEFFKHKIPIGARVAYDTEIAESTYHHSWEQWDSRINQKQGASVVNVNGWLQSPKYWESYEKEIKDIFEFTDEFKQGVYDQWSQIVNNDREVIAISIRVGQDYKDNGNYEILPISYYISALYEKFPSWRNYNIIVFSDDVEYARRNFEGDNIYFANLKPIEQLCLATMCNHFICANSTFSWWMAYLGEKEGSKVIYPSKYFKGELAKYSSTKDFWPENWEKWNYNEKIDARDLTFTIPVTKDSDHRKENLYSTIEYLRKHLNTNIIVGEQGTSAFEEGHYEYVKFPYKEFHRTKMLNDMAYMADTKYIVNQDADVIVPIFQYAQAIDLLKAGTDMVFPYDGRMARVQRELYPIFQKEVDCGYFKGSFKGTREFDPPSVGGVIMWNKENFVFGGMENENMVNYGPEDVERVKRMNILGYKIGRVKGMCYHLDHWVGPNSGAPGNPHYGANYAELERISKMTNQELLQEITTWGWVNTYMGEYYADITEGSVKSASAIFNHLRQLWHFPSWKKIIDVGGGVGAWSKGIGEGYEYYCVDHKVPKHRLVIPASNYAEYDLTKREKFPFEGTFDLAICTEVAEHIGEEHAENLVSLLLSLSNNVLFSAAIPHQGGNHHVNEQWQTWWAKLFRKFGVRDALQPIEWWEDDEDIELWYRQNLVLYRKGTGNATMIRDYVHPKMYMNIMQTLKGL